MSTRDLVATIVADAGQLALALVALAGRIGPRTGGML